MGIQAQLWSETLRDAESLEYMFTPKLLAFSSRAWSKQGGWLNATSSEQTDIYESEWNLLANTIAQKGMPLLNVIFGGFQYRIPEPGVIIKEGKCYANTAFPGLLIRYQFHEDKTAYDYTGPFRLDQSEKVTFWSEGPDGRQSRKTEVSLK